MILHKKNARSALTPARHLEGLENRSMLAATPSPVITVMDSSVNAGQAVFVNGLSSSLGAGTTDTARYEWDFGDSAGSYNNLVGYSAGHIYSKPGTYNVTLKLWNQDGGFKSSTATINVASAARQTIYVSAAGSDSNSGSMSSPIKSVAKAAAMIKLRPNVEVLFRKGDTFSTSTTLELGGANVRVGSYGSGAKPVIRWDGARNSAEITRTLANATNAIIEDITIDSRFTGPDPDYSGMPDAIVDRSTGLAVRNVTFLNVGYGVQGNSSPKGLLMQDNDAPTNYGLRSYLAWCQGSDYVFLGNKVANSTHEHAIRVFGVDRMLLAYNDLKNPDVYSFETSKTTLNIQKGNYVYIYKNTLRGFRTQIGPLGGADGVNDKGARLNHVVMDANAIYDTTVEFNHGVTDAYVRNNVFKFKDTNAMKVQPFSSEYNRGVNNLVINNNAFVNTGTRGRVISVEGDVGGITLVSNKYQADNMYMGTYGTSAVYVNDSSLSSFRKIDNNVWPVPNESSWFKANIIGEIPVNYIGTDLNKLTNYFGIARWNALAQVGTDTQQDIYIDTANWPTNSPSTPTDGGSTPSTGTTPTVSSLQIVDASTGKVLVDGITSSRSISLGSLSTKNIRVQAVTNSATSSVKLVAFGSTTTDNTAPYQSVAKTIAAGSYAVSLTAYSADNLAGTKGNTLSITLTFTTSTTTNPPPTTTAPSVTKLQILDINANKVLVDNILGSTTVALSKVYGKSIAFQVVTANTKSVKITAFGKTITENAAPFVSSIATIKAAGNYAVSMTPYSSTSLAGTAGSTFAGTISFSSSTTTTPPPAKTSGTGTTGSGTTGSGTTSTTAPRIVKLQILDIQRNKVLVDNIVGDTTVYLSRMPTKYIAFRAVTTNTSSVRMSAFGRTITENAAPFVSATGTVRAGSYAVSLTPYSASKLTGISGSVLNATIKFV